MKRLLLLCLVLTTAAHAENLRSIKTALIHHSDNCDKYAEAIAPFGENSVGIACRLLEDDRFARCAAMFLKGLRDPVALGPLSQVVEKEKYPNDARIEAAIAVKEIDEKFFIEKVAGNLVKLIWPTLDLEESLLMLQIIAIYDPAIPELKTLLKSTTPKVRTAALETAKRLGPKAEKVLKELRAELDQEKTSEVVDIKKIPKKYQKAFTTARSGKATEESFSDFLWGTPNFETKTVKAETTPEELKNLGEVTLVWKNGFQQEKLQAIEENCVGFCGEKKACVPVVVYKVRGAVEVPSAPIVLIPGNRVISTADLPASRGLASEKPECERRQIGEFVKEECNKTSGESGRTTKFTFNNEPIFDTFQDFGAGGTGDFLTEVSYKNQKFFFFVGQAKFRTVFGFARIQDKTVEVKQKEFQSTMICDGR